MLSVAYFVGNAGFPLSRLDLSSFSLSPSLQSMLASSFVQHVGQTDGQMNSVPHATRTWTVSCVTLYYLRLV